MNPYKQFLKKHRAWYKSVNPVSCPILGERIIFNSKGFYHLRYDGTGTERSKNEQMYKMGLLPLVIPVIRKATKIHKFEKKYSKALGKYFDIWVLKEKVGKQATTVFVVLRRIGDGNITFYSVWKQRDK